MATCTYNPNINSSNPYAVLEVKQVSQSIDGNTSRVSWALRLYRPASVSSSTAKPYSVTANGKVVASGSTTIGGSGTKTIASGTETISHNSDGTKTISFSFSLQFDITWSGQQITTGSASGSLALSQIPRATTPTLNPKTVTIGSSITISLPRASGSFTHTLQHDFNGEWATFATDVGTSYTLTTPMTWCNAVQNSTSGTGRIRCLTYNGTKLIGEKIATFTATVPASVVPSISAVNISEAAAGIAAKFGAYVQGHSKLSVSISAAGAYDSTIKKYETQISGIPYTGNTFTTDIIPDSGTIPVAVTVTDSRGRKATTTKNIAVLEYTNPTITTFKADRAQSTGVSDEDEGTYLLANVKFSISPVGNKNDKSYKLEYMQTSAAEWTEVLSGSVYDLDGTLLSQSGILNIDHEYQVRLTISDYFKSVTFVANISSGFTLIDYHRSGRGLSFGRVAQREGYIDSYLPVHAYSGITYDIQAVSVTDFNNFETSGIFYLFGATSAQNKPVASNGWLEVFKYSTGSYILQRYTTIAGAKYERMKIAGTWRAWVLVNTLY